MPGDMWDDVRIDRRRRIVLAVRRGEALHDPDDAELAVRYANGLRRSRTSTWLVPSPPARVSIVLVLLFWVGVHLVALPSWHRPVSVAVSLALFGLAAVDGFLRFRLIRRVDRSAETNAEVLRTFGRPVPDDAVRLPGNPQAVGSVVVAPVTTLVLLLGIVVLTGDETDQPPHWQLVLFAVAGSIGVAAAFAGARLGLAGRRRAEVGATGRRTAVVGAAVGAVLTVFWIVQTALVLAFNW